MIENVRMKALAAEKKKNRSLTFASALGDAFVGVFVGMLVCASTC